MNAIEKFSRIIDEAIHEVNIPNTPETLYEPVRYTMNSRGKRLRPVIALMGCDLFQGRVNRAVHAAIALEIFHNFTLIHDDIMDQSPMRRGKPSVYKKWGINTAILAGDTMYVHAYEQLCKTEPRYLKRVLVIFNHIARKVCEGQQYDLDYETTENITIADYIRMIRLKTAVLIAGALKIGAAIANASLMNQERLYRFGESLGIAFQLQDDYLDAFGDEKTVGKTLGNDIITKKKTFLYLKALEVAPQKQKEELQRAYAETSDPEEKLNYIRNIYRKLNVDRYTIEEIDKYFHLANHNLEETHADYDRKSDLREFAQQLKVRKR